MTLTVLRLSQTPTYRHARAHGYGIQDAITQARSAAARSKLVADTIAASKRRSAAAKRGWKTRKAALA